VIAPQRVSTDREAVTGTHHLGSEMGHMRMALHWYVIHTYSGYEDKVKASIEEQFKAKGLSSLVGELRIPTEDVVEVKAGKKRVSKRKFFPGYLLIQMEMNDETWYLIKSTPKVTGFLGGNTPTPLTEAEVEDILQTEKSEPTKPKPKVLFEAGENVRVVEGPFTNFTGVIDEVNLERGKLRVMVSIFGRATPVELDFLQVEKI
jgi:transcription termination/antitermination protein NusG